MGSIQRRLIPSYIFLIIWCLFSVFPLYWMVTAATNTTVEVARGKVWFGLHAAENLKNLMAAQPLWRAMGNSFLYAIFQTIFCLFVCSLAGFGFELYADKAKDSSVWGFILPQVATPFMIMMFRQNSRNFPPAILEAARLDGQTEIGIFFRQYLPIMRSTYAAAAVVTFMNAWNAYLWPKVVMLDNRAENMPMLIANLSNGYKVDYGMLMMGVLFCSLPTMIVFFVLQKQFAEGITGSVK